jgi:hypothetical protein
MRYLKTTQTCAQSLQPEADLCKCDHLEFLHVDEEGHGTAGVVGVNNFILDDPLFI